MFLIANNLFEILLFCLQKLLLSFIKVCKLIMFYPPFKICDGEIGISHICVDLSI